MVLFVSYYFNLLFFLVYQTLGVNTVLLKLLKRHKLNPSDSKCLSQKRQTEKERDTETESERGRERETEMERET